MGQPGPSQVQAGADGPHETQPLRAGRLGRHKAILVPSHAPACQLSVGNFAFNMLCTLQGY